MRIRLVRPGHRVNHGHHVLIDQQLHPIEPDRSGKSHRASAEPLDRLGIRQLQLRGLQEPGQLRLVDFMVPADQHGHMLAVADVVKHGLDELRRRHLQELTHLLHRVPPRRRHFLERFRLFC
ncbi:MAG TPA: hypothetical protein DCP69_03615 [Candidatus Omnitrophica bacterium]|nr:hypothetical protein [Candidatus Omnitrophota bacterium]